MVLQSLSRVEGCEKLSGGGHSVLWFSYWLARGKVGSWESVYTLKQSAAVEAVKGSEL